MFYSLPVQVFFRQPDKTWVVQVRRLQDARIRRENESTEGTDSEASILEASAAKVRDQDISSEHSSLNTLRFC